MASSIAAQSTFLQPSTQGSVVPHASTSGGAGVHNRLRGGISHHEGPISPNAGFFASMNTSGSFHGSTSGIYSVGQRPYYDEGTLELLSHDMSFSALYLHEHQYRKSRGLSGYDNIDDIRARTLWRQDSNQTTVSHMPNIQETPQEDDEKEGEVIRTEGEATGSEKEKVTKSI